MWNLFKPNTDGTVDSELLKQLAIRASVPSTTAVTGLLPKNETISTSTRPTEPEDGISPGGVAGIVIGVVLALVALSAVLFFLYKRRLLPWTSRKPDTVIFSFDTSFQNLIDCSENSLKGSERRRSASSNISRPTSYPPSLVSDEPPRNYASSRPVQGELSARRSLTHSSRYARSSAPSDLYFLTADSCQTSQLNRPSQASQLNRPSQTSQQNRSSQTYQQNRPYISAPYNLQNPYYFPHHRPNYKQYNPTLVPSNVYSAPRNLSASNFYYRPSRHVDRQLMVYYNWAMNEDMEIPVRTGVQPRGLRDSRY